MNHLEGVISMLDYVLSNKRKKHLMGGILLSTSLMFAGLAFTIITLKQEEEKVNGYDNETFIE